MRFLFVILLFSSCSAWASPSYTDVPVQFYWVRGKEALPFLETKRAVRDVRGYYKKHFKINLVVKKFKKQRDIFTTFNTLSTAFERFFAWYKWSDKVRHKSEITQMLLSPLFVNNGSEWYSAGLAWVGCYRFTDFLNFSVAYITLKNADKHFRFIHAKATIAHELGHNLGAEHVPDCTLMDTNLLYCLGDNPKRVTSPSVYSIQEVAKCKITTGRLN